MSISVLGHVEELGNEDVYVGFKFCRAIPLILSSRVTWSRTWA